MQKFPRDKVIRSMMIFMYLLYNADIYWCTSKLSHFSIYSFYSGAGLESISISHILQFSSCYFVRPFIILCFDFLNFESFY